MTSGARRLAVLFGGLVVTAALFVTGAAPAAAQDRSGQQPNAAESTDPCADVRLWEKAPCRFGENVQAGVGNIVTAAGTSVFDQLYEWVAGGATWLLRRLVSLIDTSTRPDLAGGWFGRSYGLMAGLAVLLVLPLLMVATITSLLRQDWSGLVRAYLVYLPAAGIGTGLAIPLTDLGLDVTDWMSGLFLEALRGDIQAFLDSVARALHSPAGDAARAAGPGLPLFVAFVAAVVIALGAFAVWVELVLRTAGIYVATFFLPLGFAALVWPATRAWCGRLAKTLAALILSKFVIVAVLALAAAALGNLGGAGSGGGGSAGVISGAALMLLAAFSPLVLFRLADVAGGDVAAAFAGATQGRTSPVPVPDARRSAASIYGRIMRDRAGGGPTAVRPALAAVGGPVGVAAAGAGLAGTAAAAPGRMGRQAGMRLGQQAQPGGAPPLERRQGGDSPRSGGRPGGQRSETAVDDSPTQGSAAGAATGRSTPTAPSQPAQGSRPVETDHTTPPVQPVRPAAEGPVAQPARPLPSPPPPEGER